MSTVKPPLHDHVCLICHGKYPCWQADCVPSADIVYEDCVEDKVEILREHVNSGIDDFAQVN